MFNFNLKKTKIYKVVRLERFSPLRYLKPFKKISLILFVLLFLIFLYGFVPEKFSSATNRRLLGLTIISLVSFLGASVKLSFWEGKFKKPILDDEIAQVVLSPEAYNLAEFLSFASARAVSKCSKLSSTSLFYYLLKDNPKLNFVFSRLILSVKDIKAGLKDSLFEDALSFEKTIRESLKIAVDRKHEKIEIIDLLSALARTDEILQNILINNRLKKEDIDNLALWMDSLEEKIKQRKRFWDYDNLAKRGTLAKEWTAGFTITLDKYAKDLTNTIRKKDLDFVGHENDVKRVERILSRGDINNVLIVGEPGTGKRSMVYSLAQKGLLGSSLPGINYKRIVELDLPALLAQLEGSDEVELVLDKIFREVALAGNIILFIDDIHNYIEQGSRPGVINISGIITPYLRMPQFQIIGITTYEGLHRHIEKNSSILSLFKKVEVSSISQQATLTLLGYLTFSLEREHKIFISYPAIREIISLTDRYFPSLHFPEKAIDILNEVSIYVANSIKEKIVLPKHVAKIITEKSEIPVGDIEAKEKEVLLNLEHLIHQRIINQAEAVSEVSAALRRARSDITVREGPMGVFLFLGPTGVGKTETAKALAHFYFNSEKKMIRLDMSEFQSTKDISRLIGSMDQVGLLTTPVRENPFSLILLDEFEKANHNILNLFLQVFDEGSLTDGLGRKVSFRNTIIIATSNAGYKVILEALENNWQGVKGRILDYLFENKIFRPELVNRFDATVIFKSLSKENLLDIAQLMLNKLKKNLTEKGIEFIITQELKDKIVELGYSPVFGAREMRRVIQNKVENVFASALLSEKLKRGTKVSIDSENFKLIIN